MYKVYKVYRDFFYDVIQKTIDNSTGCECLIGAGGVLEGKKIFRSGNSFLCLFFNSRSVIILLSRLNVCLSCLENRWRKWDPNTNCLLI